MHALAPQLPCSLALVRHWHTSHLARSHPPTHPPYRNSTLRRVLRSTTEPYANKWLDQGVTLEWLVEHRDAYVPLEEAEAAKQVCGGCSR